MIIISFSKKNQIQKKHVGITLCYVDIRDVNLFAIENREF